MLAFGLIIIIVTHHLPYRIYSSLAGLFLVISIVLLVLTLFIGVRVNEATRWIVIPGTGFRLQTSDVAKIALVIYLARALSQYQHELNNFILVTKVFMALLQWYVAYPFRKPFNSHNDLRYLHYNTVHRQSAFKIPSGLPWELHWQQLLLFALVLSVVAPESNRVNVWKDRIEHYFKGGGSEDDNYQLNQAKIAISTAGLLVRLRAKVHRGICSRNQTLISFCNNY